MIHASPGSIWGFMATSKKGKSQIISFALSTVLAEPWISENRGHRAIKQGEARLLNNAFRGAIKGHRARDQQISLSVKAYEGILVHQSL